MKFTKNLLTSALVGVACFVATPALANYENTQSLTVDGKDLRVSETAIRALGNADGNGLLLVDDITDGLGKKQPGYKFMVMSRTYSTAAETRPPKEGVTPAVMRDVVTVHRGTKVVIGVPVVDGKMDVANAKLIDLAIVSDADKPQTLAEGQVIRPSGEQLVTEKAKVENVKFQLKKLGLPIYEKNEGYGGGIAFDLSAVIDGKKVESKVDNNFDRVFMTPERTAGAYKADPRFVK